MAAFIYISFADGFATRKPRDEKDLALGAIPGFSCDLPFGNVASTGLTPTVHGLRSRLSILPYLFAYAPFRCVILFNLQGEPKASLPYDLNLGTAKHGRVTERKCTSKLSYVHDQLKNNASRFVVNAAIATGNIKVAIVRTISSLCSRHACTDSHGEVRESGSQYNPLGKSGKPTDFSILALSEGRLSN
ncbi:predicted protein [Plenodomus lingam JN3]|uniref:Predicted protein n=1 Tax=Leptosphaeria maculans (strain JN3 / isolate v23.1.3 / race Av1-4-5-6-7-8) TaxID=985895 RepID=E5A0R5_LEPMJ|nr:predicted protein [Plenodomus lingam JN3]CBX97211.1 predicted protein [Plenodomus lingam JN3]